MAYFLIFAGAILRFLPHWPNFTPIAAMALFSVVYINKKWGLAVALLALFFSDIFIGFYNWPVMASVYGSFLIIGLLGWWLKKNKNMSNIILISLASSILFYLITNFAVWIATPWYTKNWSGLISCYYLALPFFRNSLFGDLFYIGVLFGTFEFILYLKKRYLIKFNSAIIKER